MKTLNSRANTHYKSLLQLATSQHARRESGQTILEGIHLCRAYLEHVGMPRQAVAAASFLKHPQVERLFFAVPDRDRLVLDDALFARLSELENGVGIAYVINFARAEISAIPNGASLMLDRIQDPGNIGSIFRTSVAAGIDTVFCSKGTTAAWSPKALRGAMGAHFHLKIVEECNLCELMDSSRVPIFATSSRASLSLFEVALPFDMAWLFGNEGQGADPALVDRATAIRIPQPGGMESLNVAAAAAVCLFEQVRQKSATRLP